MNFIKNLFKKTYTINFYTSNIAAYNNFKIDYAKKYYPKWWKDLPQQSLSVEGDRFELSLNMKGCAGFTDLYSQSLVIPMWSDLIVRVGEVGSPNYIYQFGDQESTAVQHGESQRGIYAPDERYCHLKLECPWEIQCDDDLQVLMLDPMYNNEDVLGSTVMSGVINPSYQTTLNVNMLYRREEQPVDKFFKEGNPIAQLVPLTENPVKIKCHLVTKEEQLRIKDNVFKRTSFFLGYKKNKKLRQGKKSKCPFGFGK